MSLLKKHYEKTKVFFCSPAVANIVDSKRFVFVLSGLLGAVFFMYFFGVRVLDPTYVDWLIIPTYQDRFQHYLGWVAYRNSDWFFPPGMHNGLTYPLLESILYSDSLPILAIPFKAISFILPRNFQYFGWVGLIFYALQGGFGGLIVKKISGYSGFSIICSLFFTMSSFMAYRMLNHTALAAHFLLLAAMYLCITKDRNRSTLRNCFLWSILMGLVTGLHIYLLVMLFGIMFIYILDDFLEYKKIVKALVELAVPMLTVALMMFLIGVFHSNAGGSIGGLGDSSTNLNQLFNPFAAYADIGAPYADFSRFIRPFPLVTIEGWPFISKQTEGNVYLGLGMFILVFIAVFAFFSDFKEYKEKLSDRKTLRKVILTVLTFIAFFVFALSPVVTFGDKILFDYRPILPGKIIILWDIFRGTGRFIWPCAYIIMITAIWAAAGKFKKKTLIFMALILIVVQFADLSGYFYAKGEIFRKEQVYITDLQSDIWDTIAQDYSHLVYTGATVNRSSILKFAVHNGLTVNDTYLARKDVAAIEANKHNTLIKLYEGNAENDMVYIFETVPEDLILDNKLFVYIANGMILGFASEIYNADMIADVTQITPESFVLSD
ncbi:MAG: DUF6311 domain-containing protein [Oscillospiraceae bacterium]|nr:DUF6311 domain-containing protein [Oscillospiraceae bacterium]